VVDIQQLQGASIDNESHISNLCSCVNDALPAPISKAFQILAHLIQPGKVALIVGESQRMFEAGGTCRPAIKDVEAIIDQAKLLLSGLAVSEAKSAMTSKERHSIRC
jgi:hypothetical protein